MLALPFDVEGATSSWNLLLTLTTPSFLPMPQFYPLQDKGWKWSIFISLSYYENSKNKCSGTNGEDLIFMWRESLMDLRDFKGSEIILEGKVMMAMSLHLSKLIECTTQKVNTNVNWILVNKYQYCFTDCKKCTKLKCKQYGTL